MTSFFKRNRFLTFGVPFLALVVGGSFALRNFSQVRYDYRSQKSMSREEVEEMGIEMKPASELTLEKQFQRMQEMDIDTWENKRGPRPWEENTIQVK